MAPQQLERQDRVRAVWAVIKIAFRRAEHATNISRDAPTPAHESLMCYTKCIDFTARKGRLSLLPAGQLHIDHRRGGFARFKKFSSVFGTDVKELFDFPLKGVRMAGVRGFVHIKIDHGGTSKVVKS